MLIITDKVHQSGRGSGNEVRTLRRHAAHYPEKESGGSEPNRTSGLVRGIALGAEKLVLPAAPGRRMT